MSNVNKDQPQDPNELKKIQEEKEQEEGAPQSLQDVENDKRLEPGDQMEWDHEEFDQILTFIMPSAIEYRNAIPNESISGKTDGTLAFDTTVVDPLLEDYVRPSPDLDKLSPAQLYTLETAFYNFVKSFRLSEAKTRGQT